MGFFEDFSQGGGGGYVAQVVVEAGYLSFRSGYSPDDRFFGVETPENLSSLNGDALQQAWNESAAEARARAGEFDQEAPDNRVFRLTVFKDTVLNQDMSEKWPKGDRHWEMVSWQDAAQEAFLPSLNEIGFDSERETNVPFWAHVRLTQDPYQKKNDPDAEDVRLVPYIARRFSNREEAVEFAGGDSSVASNGTGEGVAPPDDWNPATAKHSWNDYVESAELLFKRKLGDNYTPMDLIEAVDEVYELLGGDVPTGKLREIAENVGIPF